MRSYPYLFLLYAIILGFCSSASSLPSSADDEQALSTNVTTPTEQNTLKSIDLSEDDLRICKEIIVRTKADEKDSVDDNVSSASTSLRLLSV